MKSIFTKSAGFLPHPALKFALLAAVLLSLAMTLISDFDRHPDEKHHFLAAKYYKTHFLPPVIGDPAVRDSYSFYGVSYLNYHWIEYFLAGKFALIISPVVSDELVAVRLFNVSLFFFLTAFFIYKSREVAEPLIFAVFLLASAQIWYVFGYINNDGFALFISLLTVYQIGYEKSVFNQYLESSGPGANISGGIWFGILAGLLLTVKTNYVTFLLFIGLWLAYTRPFFRFAKPFFDLDRLKKYAVIVLVALSVLGMRVSMDFYVNGETNFVGLAYINYFSGDFEKNRNKLLEYQEEVAEYPYKPSTLENDLANSDPPMKLKAKGYGYSVIFTKWKWHEMAFRSSFGTYGYMNINASKMLYLLIGLILFTFGAYFVYAVMRTQNIEILTQLAIFLLAAFLTVFVSTYLSWTYAIQAQGRYFFPIIGMFALFVYKNRKILNSYAANAFLFSMFLLGAFSFIFTGLMRINSN